MRLVYLASSLIPSKSANSVHVMRVCEALAGNGHEVTLIAQEDPTSSLEPGEYFGYYGVAPNFQLDLVPVSRSLGGMYRFGLAALRRIRRINPELVYGRSLVPFGLLTYTKFPYAFEGHTTIWDTHRLNRFLFQRVIGGQRCRRIIVISEALKRIYAAEFDFRPGLLSVVHDAANPPAAVAAPAVDLRSRFPEYRVHVGYVGNIYHGRGIEVLIECAAALPDFGFHVVGGTEADLHRLGVTDIPANFKCHGFVPPAEVQTFRSQMDVLAAPYQKDLKVLGGRNTSAYMSPLKIFEYMSSGKPIICSDMPVLREVLDDRTALLVPPADTQAWIEACKKLENEDLRSALATAAYDTFTEHYTWKKRAKKIIDLIT